MKKILIVVVVVLVAVMLAVGVVKSQPIAKREEANDIFRKLGLNPSLSLSDWKVTDISSTAKNKNLNPQPVIELAREKWEVDEQGNKKAFCFTEVIWVTVYKEGQKAATIEQISSGFFKSIYKKNAEEYQGKMDIGKMEEVEVENSGKLRAYRQKMMMNYYASRYNKRINFSFDMYLIPLQTPANRLLVMISRGEEFRDQPKDTDASHLLVFLNQLQ